MVDGVEVGCGRRSRRFRTVSEKRRIAELTFEPGASVALVARAHGVNANQVFKWRRALKRGELSEPTAASTSLLPVVVAAPSVVVSATGEADAKEQSPSGGSIHIEFPGRVMISVEHGADRVQLVPVTIGHDFGSSVEITSGLTPADEVILDPSDSLASGTEVHPESGSQRGQS
jgi:transposase